MYIVAIAWLYVVLMMALTERSIIAGVLTFVFYGVAPLAVVLYVLGGPARWRKIRAADRAKLPEQEASEPQKDE